MQIEFTGIDATKILDGKCPYDEGKLEPSISINIGIVRSDSFVCDKCGRKFAVSSSILKTQVTESR